MEPNWLRVGWKDPFVTFCQVGIAISWTVTAAALVVILVERLMAGR